MLAALSTVWRHSSPDSASSESVVRSSMLVHDLGLSHRACDRCHGQKLRCKRENNDASCLRCQKAGVHCVPRLVRSQRRTRSTASQGRLAPEAEPQETYEIVNTAQGNHEAAQSFNTSPLPLPDLTSDLDLGLDFSPLGDDLANQHEAAFGTQIESQFDNLDPSLNEAAEDISSVDFNMLPFFTEAPPPEAPQNSGRASRGSVVRGSNAPSRGDVNTETIELDQQYRRVSRTPERQTTGSVFEGRPASSSYQSRRNDLSSPKRLPSRTIKSDDELLSSWVHRLAELNVELHQHMLSIPPTKLGSCGRKNDNIGAPQNTNAIPQDRRLQVDRTLELSYKFIRILTNAIPSSRNHQRDGIHTPTRRLDSGSSLLVLSGFMCLVDAYDKSLHHIEESIQLRSEADSSTPSKCCVMPEVAIGVHSLPVPSPARPIILACLIETVVMQTHGAVCHLIKPSSDYDNSRRGSIAALAERSASSDLGDLAAIQLQAVTAREEATLELAQDVWKLATRL